MTLTAGESGGELNGCNFYNFGGMKMATHGELTVGKLREFLDAFPSDTKIVLGQKETDAVGLDCWANTYYPPDRDSTVWVVIDHGEHW